MNQTAIDWADMTWNPITGCYGPTGNPQHPKPCWYCYAARLSGRFKRSFEPTFHPERLGDPLERKKPTRIFVCSMGEFYSPSLPTDCRDQVLKAMKKAPQHTYIILTKRPYEMADYWEIGWRAALLKSLHIWLGVTATTDDEAAMRGKWMAEIREPEVRFMSIEPILERVTPPEGLLGTAANRINWVIAGPLTAVGYKGPRPTAEWFDGLALTCHRHGAAYFEKRATAEFVRNRDLIQQYPNGAVGIEPIWKPRPNRTRILKCPRCQVLTFLGADPSYWHCHNCGASLEMHHGELSVVGGTAR